MIEPILGSHGESERVREPPTNLDPASMARSALRYRIKQSHARWILDSDANARPVRADPESKKTKKFLKKMKDRKIKNYADEEAASVYNLFICSRKSSSFDCRCCPGVNRIKILGPAKTGPIKFITNHLRTRLVSLRNH